LPERAEHEFFTIEANVPLAKLGDSKRASLKLLDSTSSKKKDSELSNKINWFYLLDLKIDIQLNYSLSTK